MESASKPAETSAAATLASLFFRPPPDATEEQRLGELRQKYRGWRSQQEAALPVSDVLDLQHEANARDKRSTAKPMRRVATVGARMSTSPVLAWCIPTTHDTYPGTVVRGHGVGDAVRRAAASLRPPHREPFGM